MLKSILFSKINVYKIFLIITVLIASGCKKEPAPELTLTSTNLSVLNKAGSEKIAFTCNGNWTVASSETWFTVAPSFGNGNGEITVTFSENSATDERNGNIVLTTGTLTKTVRISQSRTLLDIDTPTISFTKESSLAKISIVSNTNWQIIVPPGTTWINISPLSGSQNMDVNISVLANDGALRTVDLAIKYAQTEKIVSVSQQRGKNTAPEAPKLKLPANNNLDANRLPTFRWAASKDPDNDVVVYNLEYSKGGTNWTISQSIQDTVLNISAYLDANSTYSWRVRATDSMGDFAYSQTYTFKTGVKKSYFDGEFKIAQENTAGALPSEILFIGDGYISEDFEEGGKFDKEVDEGINYLFDTEPYRSYKQYFKVYKQAGYSRDQGVTQTDKNITKNTKYSVSFKGGSSMESNSDAVFSSAKLIPGVDDIKLRDLLIVLLVNENRYAGTCWTWSDGKTIAITPISRNSNPSYHYKGVLLHEAGGHGFGRLADEYVSSTNAGKTITAEDTQKLKDRFNKNHAANVDLTSDTTLVRWKHFLRRAGYDRVGVYEGAYYYPFGVWRPELTSCMINNIAYYNAASREAIVKRVLAKAGEPYSLNSFLSKDILKEPSQAAVLQTKSFNPLTFVPLAPPVYVK
jgi:hypothetical protein